VELLAEAQDAPLQLLRDQGRLGPECATEPRSVRARPFATYKPYGDIPHWEMPDPNLDKPHTIKLPERSGYHVILGVWEVADTGRAFYQVIDVNFTG
jgi:hypothetical protein